MGTPIDPPPFEYGSDCPRCTPALWAPGKTPMYMFAYFNGIINCGVSPHPAPNGFTFLLQQSPGNPCLWLHQGDVWTIDFDPWQVAPNKSRIRLYDHHGFFFFTGFGDGCAPEIIRFVNAQAACILMYAGAEGFCSLDWSGTFLDVVTDLGIDRRPNLMRETRYVDDTDIVLKATSLYQRTNLKFKVPL